MQAGGLQFGVSHAGARVFQFLIQLIEVEQVIVVPVGQGVHAVSHGPVDHGGQPGVVMGAVVAVAGELDSQVGVFVPGHIVGGIGDACGVKQVFVVVEHPEVGAEGHGVQLVFHAVVLFGAHEAGQVIAGLFHIGVQGLGKALGLPLDNIVQFLHHEHVALVAAGEHGGRFDGVVLRSDVHIFDGHAGMGGFIGFLLGDQVGGGGGVPGHNGQGLVVLGGSEADAGKQQDTGEQKSKQLFHVQVLLQIFIENGCPF